MSEEIKGKDQSAPAPSGGAETQAEQATPPAVPAAADAAAKPAAPPKPAAAAPAKPAAPAPEPWNAPLVEIFRKQFGSGIREAATYVGQNYLVVDHAVLADVLRLLRDDQQFDYCVDITAVHYPKREEFELVYILYSFPRNERMRVKTAIKDGETAPSAVPVWPTANWLEREVFDMFGIRFEGHPDLRRILLPEDWTGYPLRKDYPITQQDNEWVKIHLGIESGQ